MSNQKKIFILLALVICIGFFARGVSFCGFTASDDDAYAKHIHQMMNGTYVFGAQSNVPVFRLRLGLIVPAALFVKIFGFHESTILIYNFMLSLFSILLVFIAGKTFFNEKVGLIAAFITAILPIDARSASILLPDAPAAFWSAIGVILLYCGTRRKGNMSELKYGLCAGIMFGVSWLCKATVTYLAPFCVLYAVFYIFIRKSHYLLFFSAGIGSLIILGIEAAIYYQATSDALYRFHEIVRNNEAMKTGLFTEGSPDGWEKGMYAQAVLRRIFITGPKAIFLDIKFALLPCAGMMAVVYALYFKRRDFLFIGLWFLSLILMFNFGSSDTQLYRPLVLHQRYLYPLIYPSAILTAGLIYTLSTHVSLQGMKNAYLGYTLICFVTLISVYGIIKNYREGLRSVPERSVARIVSPDQTLYTDPRTAGALRFFWKYPDHYQLYDFENLTPENLNSNSFVFINHFNANFMEETYGYNLPEFMSKIPDHWKLKWKGSAAELYKIQG